MAQSSKISGIVVSSEDNEPIVGASIMVEGTKTGTITDIDGRFTLNVAEGVKLQISYIGMKTTVVKAKKNMVVKMESDSEVLGEVVVTGMQRVDKRLFSGAAVQLSGDDVKMDADDLNRSLMRGREIRIRPRMGMRKARRMIGPKRTPIMVVGH